MSIQNNADELESITTEIKRLYTLIKKLKNRSKELEINITSFLNEKNQPGIKYKDTTIILTTKKKQNYISKKKQQESTIELLRQNGVQNPQKVLQDITEMKKADCIEHSKLVIKKNKK